LDPWAPYPGGIWAPEGEIWAPAGRCDRSAVDHRRPASAGQNTQGATGSAPAIVAPADRQL